MSELTLNKLIKDYRRVYDAIPKETMELDLRFTIKTMQALSKGYPLSQEQIADLWEMPLENVQSILKQADESNRVELDEEGNLVGAVLSLNPTVHKVYIGSKHVYAWCAYDAMYASGVVGKSVHIVSADPVTGETIQLWVNPAGVEKVQPESAVISAIGPGTDMGAGPGSSRCSQMFFFGSLESAEEWKKDHDDVSMLTVEEVFELTNEFQINPARQLGLI